MSVRALSGVERKLEQEKALWVLKETVWEACKLEQPRNWPNGEEEGRRVRKLARGL